MSNVLDLFDQTFFVGERATGITCVLQSVWLYDRTIDMDGLREFHGHLQRGRLSRRVERSPLPFGRHRWVTPTDQSDLEIVATPRPRAEFDAWLGEQAATPLDAERGPGWHLAVLPFTDGGAGVSLVISHCLTDGVGLCEALADAAGGSDDPINWPAAGSRRRRQALREDARQTARDLPGMGRAVRAAARMARKNRASAGSATAATRPATGTDERITLPTTTIFIDADEWDARAAALGGSSNTLLEGVAARIAQRVGRVSDDGSVTLVMPVNERIPGDTRANAVANVDIVVDPEPATTDLREIRSVTKQALISRQELPDERMALLPLAPLMPQWLVRRMVSVAARSATTTSSNIGAVNPEIFRADGTAADFFAMKSYGPGVTKAIMHRTGGILAVALGRVGGHVFLSVLAYQPGRLESDAELRQCLSGVASDFALTSTFDWPTSQIATRTMRKTA
jgi:hypothetical protein